MLVSIVVVTRNRHELLKKCIISLISQLYLHNDVDVIVVDNNSSDLTRKFCEEIIAECDKVRYCFERKISASYARNSGIRRSDASWVCFIDDDGIPDENFINELVKTIKDYDFDGFGGMWYPYSDKKIHSWIPKEVTTMRLLSTNISVLGKGQTVSAGICAFKRSVLESVDCFPEHIGPRNGYMGYGEEDYMQMKMWEAGYTIGFNPNWSMMHYVPEYKMKLSWNLHRFFLKGRDYQLTRASLNIPKKLSMAARLLIEIPYLFVISLPLLLSGNPSCIHFFLINFLKRPIRILGMISV